MMKKLILFLSICLPILIVSCSNDPKTSTPLPGVKILINQVGYNTKGYKPAVISAHKKLDISSFKLINAENYNVAYSGKVTYKGPVGHWKDWKFWTLNFSDFTKPGRYYLKINTNNGYARSYSFRIGNNVLERYTLSDVIYYFKGQRASGVQGKADRTLIAPGTNKTIDVHGGWYDATGDYGIHFSQLGRTTFFNTQQVPLVAWSFIKSYEELKSRNNPQYKELIMRLLGGGLYGADFLYRMHIPGKSFYTSISAPGQKNLPSKRHLAIIHKTSETQQLDSTLVGIYHVPTPAEIRERERHSTPKIANFRNGGGMAIAALALASTLDKSGSFSQKDYLRAAEEAFNFLQKNNKKLTNNGKENIVDDYCALLAATELYKATHKKVYKKAAAKRANSLMSRLTDWKGYENYWRANDKKRPFFSPSDAGLPVVSLLEYYEIADAGTQAKILDVVKKSMQHELNITNEVTNPFGYARQLVQDTTGHRFSSFFFPHNTKAAPWWQGENARLASLATAARMAAPYFKQDNPEFYQNLEKYAWNQLNWILGMNPYNVCMLAGNGHANTNPQYDFRGSWQYTNAPGGIVNGITSALGQPHGGIDFNIPYSVTGVDNDWRWTEQWLPHAAWYMLAVSVGSHTN